MRSELSYTIDYFEKGKDLQKTIKINRINGEITHEYGRIARQYNEIAIIQAEINEQIQELGWIATEKKSTFMERIQLAKPVKEQLNVLKKKAKAIDQEDTLDRIFKVLHMILEVNGYENDMIDDKAFWDKKTDPSAALDFVMACIRKDDSPGKKKVQ